MLRNEGCRAISVRHVSTGDDFIYSSGIIFLVPFLATMEAEALLANDLIMSDTSIRSFRRLEHQNPSIISEDIGRARSMQQFRRIGRSEEEDRRRRNTVVLEDRIAVFFYCYCYYYSDFFDILTYNYTGRQHTNKQRIGKNRGVLQ